jgi:uncharacterized protein YecT (DUF1311 family)
MAWASDNLSALVPLLIAVGTGIGMLVQRKISGQSHVEDQEGLERAIRLKQLMDAEGLTLSEAKELRKSFRKGSGGLIGAEARAVVKKQTEAEEEALESAEVVNAVGLSPVPFEQTTVGMNALAGAEINSLNGQLELAIIRLSQGLSDLRRQQLLDAQEAWEIYRSADADYAALLYEGGTGASLLGAARIIELSEQRLRDLALYEAEKHL